MKKPKRPEKISNGGRVRQKAFVKLASIVLCAALCMSGLATVLSTANIVAPGNTPPGDHELTTVNKTVPGGTASIKILGMKNAHGSAYCAVYCIERGVSAGFTYNASIDNNQTGWGSPKKNEIFWIVQNGFQGTVSGTTLNGNTNPSGYVSAGLDPIEAYAATQYAIWYFTDGYAPPNDGSVSDGILTMYNALIAGAQSNASSYSPLPSEPPEIEINFSWNGGYDNGYFGPLCFDVGILGELPYGGNNKIKSSDVQVELTALSSFTIHKENNSYSSLGSTTNTIKSGEEFYVYLGSPPDGDIKIVEAQAFVDCTVTDEGFFFWCPDGTGTQAICGWGDYRVNSALSAAGAASFSVYSFRLAAKKTVNGNNPGAGSFTFTLDECDAAYNRIREISTMTKDEKGGEFFFPTIVVPPSNVDTSSGKFYYTIQEKNGGSENWEYDRTVKRVEVDPGGYQKITYVGSYVNGLPATGYAGGSDEFVNTWKGGDGDPGTPDGPDGPDEPDDKPTGNLVIQKKLAGSFSDWGVNDRTTFQARVRDMTNGAYVLLNGAGPVYEYDGLGANGSLLTFGEGQSAMILNLPAETRYRVEEVEGAHYTAGDAPERTLNDGETATLTVLNTYEHGTGYLIIQKSLAGNYTDWGVNNDTVFTARVRDVTNRNYLLFKEKPEADGSYWCVGNEVDGLSEAYTGATITNVPFSAGKPVKLSNLWSGLEYEVQEDGGAHYTTTYVGNNATFSEGQNRTVTVVNSYVHGSGNLVVNKSLAGSYHEHKVDGFTGFKVKIWDDTDKNFLLFKENKESDGTYRCVGNEADGLSESYAGATTSELTVSAGRPLYLSNLWANCAYVVTETSGSDDFTASYVGNGGMMPGAGDTPTGNITITVVNTFNHTDVLTDPDPEEDPDKEPDKDPDGGFDPGTDPDDAEPWEPGTGDGYDGDSGSQWGGGSSDGFGTTEGGGETQTGGSAPGGYDRSVPPNPTIPGRRIQPGDEDGIYIEFDEDGVPLGEWRWDDDELMWIFDEYPPLADLPMTGRPVVPIYLFLFTGMLTLMYGAALRKIRRRRPADFLNMRLK